MTRLNRFWNWFTNPETITGMLWGCIVGYPCCFFVAAFYPDKRQLMIVAFVCWVAALAMMFADHLNETGLAAEIRDWLKRLLGRKYGR